MPQDEPSVLLWELNHPALGKAAAAEKPRSLGPSGAVPGGCLRATRMSSPTLRTPAALGGLTRVGFSRSLLPGEKGEAVLGPPAANLCLTAPPLMKITQCYFKIYNVISIFF